MKTASLWLALLAALPCAAGVIVQFANDASGRVLSPAAVSDVSTRTVSMAPDSLVWEDAMLREPGAIRDCSVVWGDVFVSEGGRSPVPRAK